MTAANFVPEVITTATVRAAAAGCQGCPLWKEATQTVFGSGSVPAKIMIIGEQPGNQEDQKGIPFVGPAGKLLDRALQEADIAREDCYVTNAVKHFKWDPKGKRRIHKKPSPREVAACRPWLEIEFQLVRPKVTVCLGFVAASAVLGPKVRVLRDRGRAFSSPLADAVFITIHPSLLLRMPDRELAKQEYKQFVQDLYSATHTEKRKVNCGIKAE